MGFVKRNVVAYIDKKMQTNDVAIGAIRATGIAHNIPIISDEVAAFMCTQLALVKPRQILEIGTAIGYSGALMLMHSEAHLTTIELNPTNYEMARQHFADLRLSSRVTMLFGDAAERLGDLSHNRYQLIFIDAAKGHYLNYFKKCDKLLDVGGLIIADNVLHKGYLAGEPHPRRQRTIIQRMNQFINYVCKQPDYTSSLLALGDGVLLAVKRKV